MRSRQFMGRHDIEPEVTGTARTGDIRHCFADVTSRHETSGSRRGKTSTRGSRRLAEWVAGQKAMDHVAEARAELEERGLVA